ncbi:MAG: DNA translocase FtsK 4TM domain-containing protein [Gemmataceae bacterium]
MREPKVPPTATAPIRLDVVAFVLAAFGLLVAACVVSHDPARVPDATFPPQYSSANLLGAPGAMLAENLFDALGITVFVLLTGWFILTGTLFLRRDLGRWLLCLAGWALLVPCSALAADQFLPVIPNLAGNGGAVGAGLTSWLTANFPPAGRFLLAGLAFALGVYLSADFAVIWLARRTGRFLHALGWAVLKLFERKPRPSLAPIISSSIPSVLHAPPENVTKFQRSLGPKDVPISRTAPDPQFADGPVIPASYELPPVNLLEDPEPFPHEEHDQRLREQAALLEKTFTDYGLSVRVVGIHTGPVVTQYEISLETGLRVNRVTALSDDLALNLKVPSVRIVAPIPGKNTVGIEVPNELRAVVRLKELVLASAAKLPKSKLPLFLGKDTEGLPLVYDLSEMPHLLIAGRTGTGKSVCLNAVILSLLLTKRPDEARVIMIDPKRVEFNDYSRIPHLMCPVVKEDTKAEAILAWAVDKMEERYELLSRARVRNIASYNALDRDEIHRRVQPAEDERDRIPERMPFIVIIIDEIGDLMMTMKKEVEGHIIRLAQKSRAAGIHLILATQRPTVDVITGLIKSNLPARICFQVSSRTDSRVVLDEMGADKLLGKGDMLFLQPGTSTLVRAQGAYASDAEIQRIVTHLECDPEFETELLTLKPTAKAGNSPEALRERDELYEQAIEIVIREGRGSVSLLQRALGIGYGRAARLIDFMAEDGIVGHYNGSQARDVVMTIEQWHAMRGGVAESA